MECDKSRKMWLRKFVDGHTRGGKLQKKKIKKIKKKKKKALQDLKIEKLKK